MSINIKYRTYRYTILQKRTQHNRFQSIIQNLAYHTPTALEVNPEPEGRSVQPIKLDKYQKPQKPHKSKYLR
jgi:hypothetical protein